MKRYAKSGASVPLGYGTAHRSVQDARCVSPFLRVELKRDLKIVLARSMVCSRCSRLRLRLYRTRCRVTTRATRRRTSTTREKRFELYLTLWYCAFYRDTTPRASSLVTDSTDILEKYRSHTSFFTLCTVCSAFDFARYTRKKNQGRKARDGEIRAYRKYKKHGEIKRRR